MQDIWIAIGVMIFVAAGAALVSARFLVTDKGRQVMLLLALSLVATFFFLLYFAGQLFWARIVPLSAAIIYTNLAAGFAGGDHFRLLAARHPHRAGPGVQTDLYLVLKDGRFIPRKMVQHLLNSSSLLGVCRIYRADQRSLIRLIDTARLCALTSFSR